MMQKGTIAKKYARALFCISQDDKVLNSITNELESISAILKSNAQYSKLMLSPSAPYKMKSLFVQTAIAETQLSQQARNLMSVLLQNNRMGAFNSIIEEFKKMMLAKAGIMPISLTTMEQDKEFIGVVQKEMENILGAKTFLNVIEDESILGGFIVQVENKTMDCSLRTRLKKLSKIME